jgi:hypothetical protein
MPAPALAAAVDPAAARADASTVRPRPSGARMTRRMLAAAASVVLLACVAVSPDRAAAAPAAGRRAGIVGDAARRAQSRLAGRERSVR